MGYIKVDNEYGLEYWEIESVIEEVPGKVQLGSRESQYTISLRAV